MESEPLGDSMRDKDLEALPSEWDVVPIGLIADQTQYGISKRGERKAAFPILRMNNLQEGTLVIGDLQYVDLDERELGQFRLRRGDILFNRTNSFELVGKSSLFDLPGDYVFASYLVRLTVNPKRVLPVFLNFFLNYEGTQRRLKQLATRGVSQSNINASKLRSLTVSVPPLHEQEGIVHVLRTAQRAKEATEKTIAAARQLKASLMRHLFTYGPVPVDQADRVPLKETEIGQIPESWDLGRIGDHAKIGNGSTPKRTNASYWDEGTIPWLTSGKVHDRIIREADEFVTETAFEECHLPLVKKGSVVVAITGQGKTLGNAALLALDTCVSQHLAYIQPKDDRVIPEFLLAYLQQRYQHFREVSSGGGSTKGALTCAFLKGYPCPLPPREEQIEIAAMIEAVERKFAASLSRAQALDVLFRSLLHNLMTGRLRVHDLALPAPTEAAP